MAQEVHSGRYRILDALRGLSIILMVLYHWGYDLVYLLGVLPEGLLNNPLLNFLQPLFAGVFIVISGASSRFSQSNAKRGGLLLLFGVILSVVTILFDNPIYFGILHFLGVSILLYALFRRPLGLIPDRVQPFLWGGLFGVSYLFFPRIVEVEYLLMFGLYSKGSVGADYFPLLPWIFLFLFGTWLGGFIREGRMPGWFYRFSCRPLEAAGRHTLLIYLFHQPLFLAVIMAISFFLQINL